MKTALRCFSCGEPDFDLFIAGKPWHADCALTIYGPTHDALISDGNAEAVFVECTRCHGLMWAAYEDACPACGATTLKPGVLV